MFFHIKSSVQFDQTKCLRVKPLEASLVTHRTAIEKPRNNPPLKKTTTRLLYLSIPIWREMSATARAMLRLQNSAVLSSRRFGAATIRPWSLPRSFASPFSTSTPSAAADVVEDSYTTYVETVAIPAAVELPNVLQPRVVIFDGVCNLCHTGVKWVIRADKHRKIKFCCLQSKAAEPYMELCGVEREDVLRRFLFVEGLDSYHQGSTAALRVLSYLPLPYSTLATLLVVPVPLRDAVYDYVAKRRYKWFGKGDKCLVIKDRDMLERFIDRDEILDESE